MIKSKEYNFEPGAWSIVQMGEELIGHPTTALNELVKNAYDADAEECKIFYNYESNNKKSFIIISDNGLGMNNTILFGEWLQPSVSSKRIGTGKSLIYERNLLGSKGIGRLAAMALGRYITVVSKKKEDNLYNWIRLDRVDFKKETLLKDIYFPGGEINDFVNIFRDIDFLKKLKKSKNDSLLDFIVNNIDFKFEEGTLIIIEQLDDSVRTIIEDDFKDEDNVNFEDTEFMRSLKTLITPLELNTQIQNDLSEKKIINKKYLLSKKESIFKVYLGTNLLNIIKDDDLFELVEPFSIIKHYEYRVFGNIINEGEVKGLYICNRLEEDKIEEKFNLDKAFTLSDEPLSKRKVKEIEEIPIELVDANIGDFFFDIRVYDRESDSIEKMMEVLKTPNRKAVRKMMNELLGLKISKNGFSVKPYGEENNDWMGLAQMRVQTPATVISATQILGYIFLKSPENNGLCEKTNREGFFENKAFITFKKILRAIILEIGRRRYRYRLKHNLGRTIKSKFERPNVNEYLKYISDKTDDPEILKKSEEFIENITTTLDNIENALTFSQRLASLGSGLELVYHELSQPLTLLGGTKSVLQLKVNKIINEELKKEFKHEISCLNESISTFEQLKNSIKPAIGIARPKIFKPFDTFKKVCFLFSKNINDEKIEIEINKSLNNYEIKDYEYALWISILNIINNAVYWLKLIDVEKKIFFTLEDGNILVISNTGPLIPEGDLETIFEYGVTFKKEKNATGLGLSFTNSILSSINWEIWAENRDYGPAFLIRKEDINEQ
ncbi:hypothetical protein D4R71_04300 [bacterium]|nr:MAG: hypothetical protein D4R71_04300 [bacterium]